MVDSDDATEQSTLPEATAEVARLAMHLFDEAEIPFLVSGAFALAHYTDIERYTKDFDVCLRASDIDRALDALSEAGFETEVTSDLWLAKAHYDGQMVDLVFNSGHAEHPVDETWFRRAVEREILGRTARIVPVEELIRSKAFIMERERYDGADVAHLVRCTGDEMDWEHLVDSFGPHWHVLFAHLVLFEYIYPSRRETIPDEVVETLVERLEHERDTAPPEADICRGTLLSRTRYIVDIDRWGCLDGRVRPHGVLSKTQARGLSGQTDEASD